MTNLWEACEKGDFEDIKQLIESGADVNEKNEDGKTALFIAVDLGRLDLVKYLIEKNANVNDFVKVKSHIFKIKKSVGFPRYAHVLHVAIKTGSIDIVKSLVENGAVFNYVVSESEMNYLHFAVAEDFLEIVKCLVENGADVNEKHWHSRTALLVAAERGSLEILKYLVEHGAEVNYADKWKGTALHIAAKRGSLKIFKYLVEHGADVNNENEFKGTALNVAARYDRLEIIKCLVEHGADINHENKWTRTALYCATLHGSLEIVKYLVEYGAAVNYVYKWKTSVLHVAASRGSLDIVKYLVEHGADVSYENKQKDTALHVAIKRGSLEIVKYLVEHGADVNGKDTRYGTPLHTAINSECFDIVKYLIEHGVDTKNEDERFEYSLICLACEKGDKYFVDYLLESGTVKNIDKVSGYGSSPLSIACSNGHTDVVRTLLKYNVSVRKEEKLECKNDEIIIVLELELKKSVKHREKIQILRSVHDEKSTQVKPPLKHFAANQSLSLGASSSTFVYVGIMEDESEVAVKRMFTQSCLDAAENERNILSLIDTKKSPFIVNYRHFFRDDTFMYLIIDLCEETLRELVQFQTIEYLRQHGQRMIKEILTGLEFLHELGILHRDLKPSNVLVDLDGRMRLADFGISRVLNEGETTNYTNPKGTIGWVAAEVIEAIKERVPGRYKQKCDVQVVGMIAYFILTKGKHLYGDPLDRMTNIVKGKPINLKKLDDRNARKFVSWLTSHKLEDRPYAREALEASFLDGIETTLQRPEIIKI